MMAGARVAIFQREKFLTPASLAGEDGTWESNRVTRQRFWGHFSTYSCMMPFCGFSLFLFYRLACSVIDGHLRQYFYAVLMFPLLKRNCVQRMTSLPSSNPAACFKTQLLIFFTNGSISPSLTSFRLGHSINSSGNNLVVF